MSTLPELIAHRATAGARYAAAVAELKASYIDLDAIERALCSGKAAYTQSLAGFGGKRPWENIEQLQHTTYLPTVRGDWESDIKTAVAAKIAAFPTAD